MNAIQLLLLSVFIFGLGAILSLLFYKSSRAARLVSGAAGMLAAVIGLMGAIAAFVKQADPMTLPIPSPFGQFVLQMDRLSALMVGVISIIAFASFFYSISYLSKYEHLNLGALGFCTHIFVVSMLMVATAANAFYFLLFWELMTAASYFLVTFDNQDKQAKRAGFLYMLVAHAGGACILLAFIIFFLHTGSFDFNSFRQAQLTPGLKNLVFIITFIGFGSKAGIIPMHFWLPPAYSSAPTHISALMSGTMSKLCIYGILQVWVGFLGSDMLWWGLFVLFFGALSATLGILFALVERDIKRVLAYSSVENVGIIFLGIGIGMIGLAEGQPSVALLGFLAGLYHLVNHAFFKSLLFLGAGSVHFATSTRDLNRLGGLSKKMPWTSVSFLAGALAISAIPPLNGFFSEWFAYQSFLSASGSQNFAVRVASPLAAVFLTITGGLAAMCFIKAYGGAFSGPARSRAADEAQESPGGMIASMVFLAACCVFLGVGAPLVAPFLTNIASQFSSLANLPVAESIWIFPVESSQAILSPPWIAVLLICLLAAPLLAVAALKGFRPGRRLVKDPWACGYGYAPQMSVSASSFDQPLKSTFRRIYLLRSAVEAPLTSLAKWSVYARDSISHAEPIIERTITRPISQLVGYLGARIQTLQTGDIRLYCFYIIFTLAVLLIVIFK